MQTTRSDMESLRDSEKQHFHSRRQTWPANLAQLHNEKTRYGFEARGSVKHVQRLKEAEEQEDDYGVSLQVRRQSEHEAISFSRAHKIHKGLSLARQRETILTNQPRTASPQ